MRTGLSPWRRFGVFLGWTAACAAHAAGFTADLTPAEKSASGVAQLSPAQASALDAFVARDQSLARQGDVTSFAATFSQRRTALEKAKSGLDRLAPPQVTRLDALVARALAEQPPAVTMATGTAAYAPGEPFAATPWRPEVHGELSLVYGTGKGGSFYGSSLETTTSDPSGRFSFSLGLSEYRGKGLFAPCGGPIP